MLTEYMIAQKLIAKLERELESISGVASSQNELLEELREYIANLEADVTRLQEKLDSIEYD